MIFGVEHDTDLDLGFFLFIQPWKRYAKLPTEARQLDNIQYTVICSQVFSNLDLTLKYFLAGFAMQHLFFFSQLCPTLGSQALQPQI